MVYLFYIEDLLSEQGLLLPGSQLVVPLDHSTRVKRPQ